MFKPGDKIVRTKEDFGLCIVGKIYTVVRIKENKSVVILETGEPDFGYDINKFTLLYRKPKQQKHLPEWMVK